MEKKQYYRTGELRTLKIYHGKGLIEFKKYYQNGNLSYHYFRESLFHLDGLYKCFYEMGDLKFIGLYRKNNAEGMFIDYALLEEIEA